MSKQILFVAILILVFLIAFLNVTFTGRYSVPQPWKALEHLALASSVYGWYHFDKAQRQFSAGAFQNVAVVALPIVAIPVYLFRSRGAMQGTKAFILYLICLGAMLATLIIGGAIAKQFAL